MNKHNMYKTLVFTITLLISSLAIAQNNFSDPRLISVFESSQISNWEANHPQILAYWEFYLDNSYVVIESIEGKSQIEWPSISLGDADSFNILDIPHVLNAEKRQYFQIEGLNKILMIFSQAEIISAFNTKTSNR